MKKLIIGPNHCN